MNFPKREEVKAALEQKLASMKERDAMLDSITYAGNGEPTIHPHFEEIVNDTIALRNKYFPGTVISVLTNASKVGAPGVADALLKIEQPILKLDAGTNEMFRKINNPRINISLN
jgi:wyosine [tRNA(Phe)-imidazoG37] synthetase (radical SAM superfamily)